MFLDKAAKAEFKAVETTETLGNITSGRPVPPQNRRRPRKTHRVTTERTDLFEVGAIEEGDEDESTGKTVPNILIGGGTRELVEPSSTDDKAEEPKEAVGGKLIGSGGPMGGMPRPPMGGMPRPPMGGMPMGGMPMGGMPMGGMPMGGAPRGVSMRGPRMPGGMGNPMMAEMLNKRKSMQVPKTNASIEEAIKLQKSKSKEVEENSEAGNASQTDDEPEKKKDEKKHKGLRSGFSSLFGGKKKDKK